MVEDKVIENLKELILKYEKVGNVKEGPVDARVIATLITSSIVVDLEELVKLVENSN